MSRASRTPSDLDIRPRNLRFVTAIPARRQWHGGDPITTALYNAFSATFPEGEKLFIESVVRYRDQVSEPLKGQIVDFARQEGNHTREHLAFNAHIAAAGYDMSRIEARTLQRVTEARTRPALAQLAVTAALEHFTAILAHASLKDPHEFDGAPPEIARLWRWHAIEEIEHKAVAFDTLRAATAGIPSFRRWAMRCVTMLLVTIGFVRSMTANVADLLRQDGFEPAKLRWRALRILFVGPGLLSRVLPHYLAYFRPGFHPWDVDDRDLIGEAEASVALPVAA